MKSIQLDTNDPKHRVLSRLILARQDWNAARSAVLYVIENITSINDPLFEAMSCASVICYSRPFIGRREYPSIPGKYTSFNRVDLKRIHGNIVDFRNEFVAHRDAKLSPVTIIPKGSEITFQSTGAKGILTSHGDYISSHHLGLEVFPVFRELIDLQIDRIKLSISKTKEALFP